MALLAILQHDAVAEARLRSALAGEHDLLTCERWTRLWDVVHKHAVDGCILDIYDPGEPVALREVQRLRRRRPPMAIVVYADFRGRELDLFELGALEIDAVIQAEGDDSPRRIREVVRQALGAAAALRIVSALTGRLPPLGLDCLRWSVENAHAAPSVSDLADAFSMSGRTLACELRERDLPPPSRFLLWGRLFRAAQMLADSDRTVETVAFSLGYSSGTALGRAFRRETGHPPTEALKRGGIACVLEGFLGRDAGRGGRRRRWSAAGQRWVSYRE